MNTKKILEIAEIHLKHLPGEVFDAIELGKPDSIEEAKNLIKIVSKLSPLVGNLIEFDIVSYLNEVKTFKDIGEWKRQDPGFPDAIFCSEIKPPPGFEIKAWFPLATEITARFKDSQNHFIDDQTSVLMLTWLPENIFYGKPKIIDYLVVPGKSVAKSRDDHYSNPPDYIVLEPEDTSLRSSNLQQTNTNGYKFQGSDKEFINAQKDSKKLGLRKGNYSSNITYQSKLRSLLEKYKYRLDTNYAKMNRIENEEINKFKNRVFSTLFHGKKISEWNAIFNSDEEKISKEISFLL